MSNSYNEFLCEYFINKYSFKGGDSLSALI